MFILYSICNRKIKYFKPTYFFRKKVISKNLLFKKKFRQKYTTY